MGRTLYLREDLAEWAERQGGINGKLREAIENLLDQTRSSMGELAQVEAEKAVVTAQKQGLEQKEVELAKRSDELVKANSQTEAILTKMQSEFWRDWRAITPQLSQKPGWEQERVSRVWALKRAPKAKVKTTPEELLAMLSKNPEALKAYE